jgi:phosphoglycerate kinase
MKLESLKKNIEKIKAKKVFLRTDFNVPVSKGKVVEDFKIRQSLETIKFLLKANCQIILASHLSRPKSGFEAKYSLRPIAKRLSGLLAREVNFLDFKKFSEFKKIREEINKGGDIFFLDNLRFYSGESRNCKRLAKSLASLADIYVNDAFAVSHRSHSSVDAIKKFLPSFGGLLLEKELKSLDKVFKGGRPFILIMGGSKIETKLPTIEKLYSRSSKILLGGVIANTFYLSQGFDMGKSLAEKNKEKVLSKFLKSSKIVLPVDMVTKTLSGPNKGLKSVKKVSEIEKNDSVLDIGPETILSFSKYINKAKTIVWNGPMGMFEDKDFSQGTILIAKKIASRSSGQAFALAGGGETVKALKASGMKRYMNWVSTGGGAMLLYLSGEKMPGLD